MLSAPLKNKNGQARVETLVAQTVCCIAQINLSKKEIITRQIAIFATGN